MNLNLSPDLEQYVESLVRKGGYTGCSEVVQEALRQHRVSRPTFQVVMTPELERLLDEGMEERDKAETTDSLRRR